MHALQNEEARAEARVLMRVQEQMLSPRFGENILGAIQDGLMGDIQLLVVKSVMDAFAAFAFASTLGVGTLFSAPVVLLYQGSFTLLAAQLQKVMTAAMIAELTATGGILLIGLAISSLLEIKKIRVANFLPALGVSPLLVWVLHLLGLSVS